MLCYHSQDSIAHDSVVSSSSSSSSSAFELKMRLRLLDLNVLLYHSHQPAWMAPAAIASSSNSSSRNYSSDGWNSDALASGGSHFLLSAQHMAYSLHKAGTHISIFTSHNPACCLSHVA
jgi:hypothetical protein